MSALYRKSVSNPFDKYALSAKIPDGKATTSNALRVQGIGEFTLPSLKTKTNAGYDEPKKPVMLFFPGLNNSIIMANGGTDNTKSLIKYGSHVRFDPVAATAGSFKAKGEVPLKWRLVSTAMRVQLVNNMDENEGWFEAIRVDPSYSIATEMAKFGLTTEGIITGANSGSLVTSLPFVETTNESWANHPTYVTGKIKELHQYMWNLNPTSREHDFRTLPITPAAGSTAATVPMKAALVDISYDCLAIRFHPRVDPSTTDVTGAAVGSEASPTPGFGQPTRLVVHSVSNQEMIFDETSMMATTATAGGSRRSTSLAMAATIGRIAPGRASLKSKSFGYGTKNNYSKKSTGRKRTYKTSYPKKRTKTKRYVNNPLYARYDSNRMRQKPKSYSTAVGSLLYKQAQANMRSRARARTTARNLIRNSARSYLLRGRGNVSPMRARPPTRGSPALPAGGAPRSPQMHR